MAALLVVILAIALVTGDRRIRMAVGLLAVAAALAGGAYMAIQLADGKSINRITSDRTERVEDTTRVIEEHPLIGVGIGGQPRASRELARSDRPSPNFVSHTTPLTVFAELGVVGLALYAWLLVGGARMLLSVYHRDQALGLALSASFLALFVHALFYSGFLEDPLTWFVLAVGAGYLSWHAARDPQPSAADRARSRMESAPVGS